MRMFWIRWYFLHRGAPEGGVGSWEQDSAWVQGVSELGWREEQTGDANLPFLLQLDQTTDFEERRLIRNAMRELRQRKRGSWQLLGWWMVTHGRRGAAGRAGVCGAAVSHRGVAGGARRRVSEQGHLGSKDEGILSSATPLALPGWFWTGCSWQDPGMAGTTSVTPWTLHLAADAISRVHLQTSGRRSGTRGCRR